MLPNAFYKISWLWFLPALFIGSIINYPILKWNQRRLNNTQLNFRDDIVSILGLIFVIVMWGVTAKFSVGEKSINYLLPNLAILLVA